MRILRMTRRDKCYLAGKRARLLNMQEAHAAWAVMADYLVEYGEKDVPRFDDLMLAIRRATISARTASRIVNNM